jgi:hypothetical protein
MKVSKSTALEKTEAKAENTTLTPLASAPIEIGQEGIAKNRQEKGLSQESIKTAENKANYFFLSESQQHETTPQALLVTKADGDSPQLKTQVDRNSKLENTVQLGLEEDWNEAFLLQYIDVKNMSSTYQKQRESALNYLHKHLDQIDINYDKGIFILFAAQKNDTEMVQFLLEHGARQGLLDALGTAGNRGYTEMTKILIAFLKKQGIDFSELRYTTSYTNFPHIRVLFDQEFAITHPNL